MPGWDEVTRGVAAGSSCLVLCNVPVAEVSTSTITLAWPKVVNFLAGAGYQFDFERFQAVEGGLLDSIGGLWRAGFWRGAPVEIHGLQRSVDLNGRRGVCEC